MERVVSLSGNLVEEMSLRCQLVIVVKQIGGTVV